MNTKKQLKKDIKLLEKLRDKALENSTKLPYLFARNLAKQAYNGFVKEIKTQKEILSSSSL